MEDKGSVVIMSDIENLGGVRVLPNWEYTEWKGFLLVIKRDQSQVLAFGDGQVSNEIRIQML
jgi:hypothetical protein